MNIIIKKNTDKTIQKNIGKIFRKYNIIEYKSPSDYLSIDTFYRVYAYACFYKIDTQNIDQIQAEEITITFVCNHYPRKLIKYLKTKRNYRIERQENGIYYIEGDYFPMQIICTEQLKMEENFWLRNLTNQIKTKEQALEVMHAYEKHNNEKLYESVVDIIVKANSTTFKEVSSMCEALEKIYAEKYVNKYTKLLEEKDIELEAKDIELEAKDAYISELERKLMLLTS